MASDRQVPRSVYVASDGSGLHKIGISRDPQARCNSLSHRLGRPVEMVFSTSISRKGREVESAAHHALADFHQGSEWFAVTPEVAIATVRRAFADNDAGDIGARPVPLDREPPTELQARAKTAGLTQKRLAEILGVTETTASLQLRGKWASGTPQYVLAVLIAWEILSHDQRMRWLDELAELKRREKP